MTAADRRRRAVGAALIVIVVAAVVAGIILVGPPSEARLRQLDERRVEDLMALGQQMDVYYTRRGALPPSLDSLSAEPGIELRTNDRVTGASYEFRALDARSYELCATFDRASDPEGGERTDRFWTHGAGRTCFRRDAREVR